MIDLTQKALPDAIEVSGEAFPLRTDFRVWIRFARAVAQDDAAVDFVFAGAIPPPTAAAVDALMRFYTNPNSCPQADTNADTEENTLDFDADSELIVAAFLQQYGIDLTSAEFHWHVFKALLLGITTDTLLGVVMQARSYTGKDEEMQKMKARWALPTQLTAGEQQAKEKFDALFEDD